MQNYKLIACDLDGTLVNTDLTISADNKKAISEFKKMGVHFVPCTGRTLSEMQEVVANPDIRYIIYSNGAAIWDKETDKTTFLGFSKETAAELMDILLSFDCFIIIHYRGETFVDIDLSDDEVEKYNVSYNVQELIRDFANKTDNLKNTVCAIDGIESITVFFCNTEDTETCRKLLLNTEKCAVVDGWNCNLEVFRKDTSKGNALCKISEMLGIDLKDTISMGDSGNDISMTKVSGLGIAVSNGAEALKEVADEIICSNDESAVKYVLENFFEVEI